MRALSVLLVCVAFGGCDAPYQTTLQEREVSTLNQVAQEFKREDPTCVITLPCYKQLIKRRATSAKDLSETARALAQGSKGECGSSLKDLALSSQETHLKLSRLPQRLRSLSKTQSINRALKVNDSTSRTLALITPAKRVCRKATIP